jgi:hypothetical protein
VAFKLFTALDWDGLVMRPLCGRGWRGWHSPISVDK